MDHDFEIEINYGVKTLRRYRGNEQNLTIPDGINTIDWFAFANNSTLSSVQIPGSVSELGRETFKGCHSLISVVIAEGVKIIGDHAFYGCTSLTRVNIPGSVTEIRDWAFDGCWNLESVVIPKGVIKIGKGAFLGCQKLEIGIYYYHEPSSKSSFQGLRYKTINLLDEENLKIAKLLILDAETETPNTEFATLLMSGLVNHLSVYDAHFLSSDETVIRKVKAAICRLEYPLELQEEYKKVYISYLQKNASLILPVLIKAGDVTYISILAGVDALLKGNFNAYIELAHKFSQTEILAILLDYKNRIWEQDSFHMFELDFNRPSYEWITQENEDGSLAIARYQGKNLAISIPSILMGKKIKSVSGGIGSLKLSVFFTHKDKVQSIIIEDGIEVIDERAFLECRNLKTVLIPSSVIEIRGYAFSGCHRLTSVVIPEGVEVIGEGAFENCSSLSSMQIPGSVREIGENAFIGTPFIMNSSGEYQVTGSCFVKYTGKDQVIEITQGIKVIYDNAFADLNLVTVVIPEGVEMIGFGAFSNCTALRSVQIPGSVTKIGTGAFSGCTKLVSVEIPRGVKVIGAGAFKDCTSLSSVQIPSSAKEIGGNGWYGGAFQGCSNLVSVVIFDGVKVIGYLAFYGCTSLTRVNIPGSVTEIGGWAFEGCSSLVSVLIPEGVIAIGKNTFKDCTSLSSVQIPGSVKVIGQNAFKGCTSLSSAQIPGGVTEISESAFSGCRGLNSVVIQEGVKVIGAGAFKDCTSLSSVQIPRGVTEIGGGSWFSGSGAFEGCSNLVSVVIPEEVKLIGKDVFEGCSSLKSVVIPQSVAEIGDYAFSGCSSLTSLIIPKEVIKISWIAFKGCDNLVIHSPKGSYAIEYAKKNGIKYVEK